MDTDETRLFDKALAGILKAEARKQGISYPDLADRAGVSKPTIARLFKPSDNGRPAPMRMKYFLQLCRVLGCDPAEVLDEAERHLAQEA